MKFHYRLKKTGGVYQRLWGLSLAGKRGFKRLTGKVERGFMRLHLLSNISKQIIQDS
jgi:hypothetical protein